jgi:hypothetical protein
MIRSKMGTVLLSKITQCPESPWLPIHQHNTPVAPLSHHLTSQPFDCIPNNAAAIKQDNQGRCNVQEHSQQAQGN